MRHNEVVRMVGELARWTGGVGAAVTLGMAAAGCEGLGQAEAEPREELGVLTLAIAAAPERAQCLEVTLEGAQTVTRTFALVPGRPAHVVLGGLPLGSVRVTEAVYSVPCHQLKPDVAPIWISERAVSATLTAGRPVEVAVVLRPAGQLSIRNDFQEGTGTLAISPGSHDFGELTEASAPPPVTFTVRNTGPIQLPNVNARIDLGSGTGLALRAGTGCSGVTLAPGASCAVEVRAVHAPWLVPGVPQTASLVVTSGPGATATASLRVMPR